MLINFWVTCQSAFFLVCPVGLYHSPNSGQFTVSKPSIPVEEFKLEGKFDKAIPQNDVALPFGRTLWEVFLDWNPISHWFLESGFSAYLHRPISSFEC